MQFCVRSVLLNNAFAVLLADDFLTDYYPGATADLVKAYEVSGKSQLSVMEVDGPDISRYGVVVPDHDGTGIVGLVKAQDRQAPSNGLDWPLCTHS